MWAASYAAVLSLLMLFNSKFTPEPLSWINLGFSVVWAVTSALMFWQVARRA